MGFILTYNYPDGSSTWRLHDQDHSMEEILATIKGLVANYRENKVLSLEVHLFTAPADILSSEEGE